MISAAADQWPGLPVAGYACGPMTTTKTATGAVVDFIQSARFADFPAEALTIAKRCIVDGLGVMLAGSTQDAGRILHEHVQGTDPRAQATVFGPKPFKTDRKSTRLNSSHSQISYAVFCL